MTKKVLFVTATAAESKILEKVESISEQGNMFRFGSLEIYPLITGVGQVATIYSIFKWISGNGKPDIAINTGIAGCFGEQFSPGDVLVIKSDCFGDLGIEDGDNYETLAEAGLADPDEFPAIQGKIPADSYYIKLLSNVLPAADAVTVNTATGSEKTCNRLIKKFNASLETMEGASFFYICRSESIPFFAVRAVSNRVGPRDRNKWMITPALDNLTARLKEVFLILEQ